MGDGCAGYLFTVNSKKRDNHTQLGQRIIIPKIMPNILFRISPIIPTYFTYKSPYYSSVKQYYNTQVDSAELSTFKRALRTSGSEEQRVD